MAPPAHTSHRSAAPAPPSHNTTDPAPFPPPPPSGPPCNPSLSDHLSTWKLLLKDDPDAPYLLDGIEHGFKLQDESAPTQPPPHPFQSNYRSALSAQFRPAVESTLKNGLRDGLFTRLDSPPPSTSPLSAVPKDSGGTRVIHDLSSPLGACLNDFSSKEDVHFQTINDAVNLLSPGCYLAKVDLKSAYRSVRSHPSSWPWTTLHWQFEDDDATSFLYDTRLPFGARRSPGIFHRITQAVRRALIRQGFPPMVVYVDDFLIIAPTADLCATALQTLITTLRSLGFMIAWDKVVDPTQRLTFLGIEIDTRCGTLSLNADKTARLVELLKRHLKRKRLSRKQLQSLAGRLTWAAAVLPWGRLHVRSLFDQIACLHGDNHKILVSLIAEDLQWWLVFLHNPSYRHFIWDRRPEVKISCDASQAAGGAFCLNDWFFTAWSADLPSIASEHINIKELAIAIAAVFRWADALRNKQIVIVTDNAATQAILNKGTSPAPAAAGLLRLLSALIVQLGSSISAVHIPGCLNHIPDAISRLHSPGHLTHLGQLLRARGISTPILSHHMSNTSLLSLHQVFPQLQTLPSPS